MSREKLYVINGAEKVPFMRGMITHSLMERGLKFQEAYDTASAVRDKVRERKTIGKEELSRVIQSVVREKYGDEYARERSPSAVLPPQIMVKGPDSDIPFSKGILSRSLQASGLEPSVAYDIAREIEGSMLERGQTEIGRDELRRLIYDTTLRNHDVIFAERYLLWRLFKSPDKPLIILIGGATGTGKTSVATEVAHRLGISKILSTDTIRQIMRMMFSHDLMPAIHYSSYEAWKNRMSIRDEEKSVAVIEAFTEQSMRVLVGVRAMVERAIQENFNLVIDGVHLVPGLMDLERFEDHAYIVPLVISTTNRASYLERFPIRQAQAGNRMAKRYRAHFEYILQIQDSIIEMARQHDTPVVENESFDETVASVLNIISHSIREKLNISMEELIARTMPV
ncbi:MAG: ATP cone domain-containing protein [Acidobacteriota bacterium]